MTQQLGSNYKGIIPFQEEGVHVSYYIHAADASGRSADHPIVGSYEPHEFTVVQMLPGIMTNPDTLEFFTATHAVEGLQFTIKPDGDESATIENINLEGSDEFYWMAEPVVNFPYQLPAGDSLVFTVYVPLPTDQLMGFLQDTIFIECEGGDESVLIIVDEDLISGIDEQDMLPAVGMLYPNPFDNRITFDLTFSRAADIEVSVFDNHGMLVNTIVSGMYQPGQQTLSWDGRAANGSNCAPGIYFLVIRAGDMLRTEKIIKR
jgi:hypothetical protein